MSSSLIYKGLLSRILILLNLYHKLLFLKILLQVLSNIRRNRVQICFQGLESVSTRISETFRKFLIKPCKSLKDLLSYLSYVSNRCTCQYHGIRYSVCPEMEFDIFSELILGRLNVN